MQSGLQYWSRARRRRVRLEKKTIYDVNLYNALEPHLTLSQKEDLKGWSRSYYTKTHHDKALFQYDRPILSEPKDIYWTEAQKSLEHRFRDLGTINTLNYYYDFDEVKFESSSLAGYNYAGKKGELDNFGLAKSRAKFLMVRVDKSGVWKEVCNSVPDLSLTRTQLSNEEKWKVRNIFGEPFHTYILESLSAQPLAARLMELKDNPIFYGLNPLIEVPKTIDKFFLVNQGLLDGDFPHFDSQIQPYEHYASFDWLSRSHLQFPNRLSRLTYKYVRKNFVVRKIVDWDGIVWMKYLGTATGSKYTAIMNSFACIRRLDYLFLRTTGRTWPIKVQGDDFIVCVPRDQCDIKKMCDIAAEVGWDLDADDFNYSLSTKQAKFLSRSSDFGLNYRDPERILKLAVYPEHPVESGAISTARAHALLEDCNWVCLPLLRAYQDLYFKFGEAQLPREHAVQRIFM